jgi:ABC-type transport system involved in cytochrome bd biosynthesis fused ATPase/permease subunit
VAAGEAVTEWANPEAVAEELKMIKNVILDLIGGAWTVLGLLFAVVVLPEGQTQTTMATLFVILTIGWLVTGPLRWKE